MALKPLNLLIFCLSILVVAHLYEVEATGNPNFGGYTLADPKDPKIVKIGKFAVSEHNKEAHTDLEFITVVKAETQPIFGGTNYRLSISAKDRRTGKIETYQAVVWSQPWNGFLKLVSFDKIPDTPAPGPWTPIPNLTDPKIVKIAKFAVNQHNKDTGSHLRLEKIIKGEQRQVVSGINYRLVISAKDVRTGITKTYQAVVWSKPWSNFLQLTSFEEVPTDGWNKIHDLNDPEVVKVAKFAVAEHNKQTGSNLIYVSIMEGEKQAVWGTNYRLVIAGKNGWRGNVRKYVAVVYARSWENFYQLRSFDRV